MLNEKEKFSWKTQPNTREHDLQILQGAIFHRQTE